MHQRIVCRWCGKLIAHYYETFEHIDCTQLTEERERRWMITKAELDAVLAHHRAEQAAEREATMETAHALVQAQRAADYYAAKAWQRARQGK
jgi:hypothetical protein